MAARPQWYRPDGQLMARMIFTMFMIGVLYVAFVLILARLGMPLAFLIIIAAIIAGIQFFVSDKIVLWSMGAREVTEAEQPRLHAMVERLAQQANLPKPKIAIANTSVPNAFATGRDEKHAVVCVTTGIMDRLNDQEMEAVLAHELTHVINRDMLVMAIAAFLSMIAALATRWLFNMALWGGMMGGYGGRGRGRGDQNAGAVLLIATLVSMVVYFIGFLLTQALSRYREYAADRGSALITGEPEHLISALMKIDNTVQSGRIPDRDLRQAEPANAMGIFPAIRGGSMSEIFSTHPSLQHRIAKLQAMQEQMEQAPRLH